MNQSVKIAAGVLLLLVSVAALVLGGWPLIILSCALMAVGAAEYKNIMMTKGFTPFFYIIVLVAGAIIILGVFNLPGLVPVTALLGVAASFGAVMVSKRKPYIANITVTILGFMICWLLSYIIFLAQISALLFLFLVAAVVATDAGAYFFGKRFGKTKLIPEISPNKTVFGAVAGGVCACAAALALGCFLGLGWGYSLAAGVVITFCAQFGDFSISILKRDAGMKHSGELFAGRGGMLDRIAPFLFSAPAAYYYFRCFLG